MNILRTFLFLNFPHSKLEEFFRKPCKLRMEIQWCKLEKYSSKGRKSRRRFCHKMAVVVVVVEKRYKVINQLKTIKMRDKRHKLHLIEF